MKALKFSSEWLNQLGELIRPHNEQERREYRLAAILVAFVAALALLYHFLT